MSKALFEMPCKAGTPIPWFTKSAFFIIDILSNLSNPSRIRTCRFEPTCSVYAKESLEIHGPMRAAGLTLLRLLRCQPWGPFGHDPVPRDGS